MRKAIGMHFGHDAGIAIIKDGESPIVLEAERLTRVKHAIGLPTDLLLTYLDPKAAMGLATTQNVPMLVRSELELSVDGGIYEDGAMFLSRTVGNNPSHDWRKFASWRDYEILRYRGPFIPESNFIFNSSRIGGWNKSYEAFGMVSHTGRREDFLRPAVLRYSRNIQQPGIFYQHHYLHAMYAAAAACRYEDSLIVTCDGGSGPNYEGGGSTYLVGVWG